MFRIKLLFLTVSLFCGSLSFARENFQSLRFDKNIPYHCSIPKNIDFIKKFKTATISITNAVESGFTHEFPLSRNGANLLWRFAKKYVANKNIDPLILDRINNNPRLKNYKELIVSNFSNMGFNFKSEGEILEILVLLEFKKNYPPEDYYFTGGIEYFKVPGPVLGELDIIVAQRSDCKAVLIGETKLGLHRLQKAKKQIHRFVSFVKNLNENKKTKDIRPLD